MFRYKLRTLLIATAIGPPALAITWFALPILWAALPLNAAGWATLLLLITMVVSLFMFWTSLVKS